MSAGTVAAFSRFALWVANGSVGNPLLEDTDYSALLKDPSCMEQVWENWPEGDPRLAHEETELPTSDIVV